MIGLVTVQDYINYAAGVGVDLSAVPIGELEADLAKAIRLIDSLDGQLKGKRTSQTQEHAYPRRELTIYGDPWPSDVVPKIAKDCQMAFALEAYEGDNIFEMTTAQVTKERVDVLEVAYASTASEGKAAKKESLAMNLLRELMEVSAASMGGIGFLKVTRT